MAKIGIFLSLLNLAVCTGQNQMVTRNTCCECERLERIEHTLEAMNTTLHALVKEKSQEHLRDCFDLKERGITQSGVYTINLNCYKTLLVYCDMDTDGGGWTVFQRRRDGSVNFFRDWEDYKTGFGDLYGEFWLGNENIHHLTNHDRRYELRIDLQSFDYEERYAIYDVFSVNGEEDNYRLNFRSYSGNAGDGLGVHHGMQFSTKDRDHDTHETLNCAASFTGAWWYIDCHNSNLNGVYHRGEGSPHAQGVTWEHWKGDAYSLKHTEMKIRPMV